MYREHTVVDKRLLVRAPVYNAVQPTAKGPAVMGITCGSALGLTRPLCRRRGVHIREQLRKRCRRRQKRYDAPAREGCVAQAAGRTDGWGFCQCSTLVVVTH